MESDKLPQVSLIGKANFSPRPKHFYNGEVKNGWYNEYNWKIEPTTGPYVVNPDKCVQGEMLVVEKVKNWWGHEYPNRISSCKNLTQMICGMLTHFVKTYILQIMS